MRIIRDWSRWIVAVLSVALGGTAIAQSHGLLCDPPERIGWLELPGSTQGMVIVDGLAYVADGAFGVHVIDVTDPAQPQIVHTVPSIDARSVYVQGSRLYVTGRTLYVLDIVDPRNAVVIGSYRLPYFSSHVLVADGLAYIGARGELFVLDVSGTSDPQLVSATLGFEDNIQTLAFHDDYLLVGSGGGGHQGGITVADITDPSAPQIVSHGIEWAHFSDFALSGDTLFATTGPRGLYCIDVSDPVAPTLIAELDTVQNHVAASVTVSEDVAFVGVREQGIWCVDVTVPAEPTVLHSLQFNEQNVWASVQDGWMFVADFLGELHVLTWPGGRPHVIGRSGPVVDADDVAVAADWALVAGADEGLVIFDVSEPAQPMRIAAHATAGEAQNVTLDGNRLATLESNPDGLSFFDVSDPAQPQLLGTYATTEWPQELVYMGSYALVALSWDGLLVLDVSDPSAATAVATYPANERISDVSVVGSRAYLVDTGIGIVMLDLTDPHSPRWLGTYENQFARGIEVRDGLAYLEAGSRLQVVDVIDPSNPVLVSEVLGSGNGKGTLAGDTMTSLGNGFLAFTDISDPSSPQRTLSLPGRGRLTEHRGLGFVAMLSDGFEIINLTNCPCRPDLNEDGVVDTRDFLEFLGAWVGQEPVADWDGSGSVDTLDFIAFLSDWVAGC